MASVTIEGWAGAQGWTDTWGHVGTQVPHCYWGHVDLANLCCQLGPWWHPGQGCCHRPCLGPWCYCSLCLFYAHDLCYHQRTHSCHDLGCHPWQGWWRRAILQPGHTHLRDTHCQPRPWCHTCRAVAETMSGPVVQWQSGSVEMLEVLFSTRVLRMPGVWATIWG